MKLTVAPAAAFLAAGLICTWDPPRADATPVTFKGTLAPTDTLTDVYFLFGTGLCDGHQYTQKVADIIPGGATTPYSVTVDIADGVRADAPRELYTIVGLYTAIDPGTSEVSTGVAIAYNTVAAAGILSADPAPSWTGRSLPAYSGGVFGRNTDPEAAVISDLLTATHNGQPFDIYNGPLFALFGSEYLAPPAIAVPLADSSFTFVTYSGAAAGGGGTLVEVVPEPAGTCLLITAGGAVLAARPRPRPRGAA